MLDTPTPQRPIKPVRTAAPYVGGKRLLASRIIERVNGIDHTIYAEPFVGMGGVFFRRNRAPKCEIINDYNGDVANLFRILQRHHLPFTEMLKFQLTSRQEFERLATINPATLTDLERAARFLYLQKSAFGGNVVGQALGVDRTNTARFNAGKLRPILEDIHERLSRVVIECLPYGDFIERYDGPTTLFYLDPPYWGTESYYGKGLFRRADFNRLAEQLAGIKGNFILSLNDTPGVRKAFSGFAMEEVSVEYTVRGFQRKTNGELIISRM